MTCDYHRLSASTYRCQFQGFNYTTDTKIISINGTHVAGGYSDNNVTSLYFPSQVHMENFPQEILNKFTNVETIQAIGATLKSIQPLESCSRLKTVFLQLVRDFEGPDKDAFKNCIIIDKISIINSRMPFVFPIGMNLPSLSEISISGGNISRLTRDFFSGLKNLKSLDFSSSRITLVDPNTFTDLKLLETLKLGSNEISEISPNTFNSLTKLTELYLNGNLLTKIDDSFTKQLQGMEDLYLVSLDNNKITNITATQFYSMGKLNLGGNLIKEIRNDTFGSNNSKMTEISLSRNQITTIGSTAFKGLTKLVTLKLDYNNMTHLKREFFESLSSIAVLDLSRNGVETVGRSTFKAFINRKVTINLLGNNCVNIIFTFPLTEPLFDVYMEKCYVDDGTGGSENIKIGAFSILLPISVAILSFIK